MKTMSGESELKINSRFADKYDKYRQKEELQRRKYLSLRQNQQTNQPTWDSFCY